MRTEDLINKYIDGELDKGENDELRHISNENSSTKEDFDNAVLINSIIKKDAATTELPDDLRKSVKAKIDAMCFDDATKIVHYQRKPTYYFAAAVVVAFIFGFAVIGEFPLIEYYHDMAKYNSFEVRHDTIYNVVKVAEPMQIAINSVAEMPVENSVTPEFDAESNTNGDDNQNAATGSDVAFPELSYIIDNVNSGNEQQSEVAPDLKDSRYGRERIPVGRRNIGFAYVTPSGGGERFASLKNASVRFPVDDNHNLLTDVRNVSDKNFEFVTSYGGYSNSNVFTSGDDKFSIGLSQSIGYRLSGRNKIGVELGYMNYDYSENRLKTIKIEDGGNGGLIGVKPSPVIMVNVENSINDRSVFGTVYYEYRLLKASAFSVDVHGGIGLSRDGFININRLSGTFRIVNGVKLTAGVDERFFKVSFPDSGTKSAKFCSAMSLLYGLQIDL